MKKINRFCFVFLVAIMLLTSGCKETVTVISIAELGVQGLLQNPGDRTLYDIRRLNPFELEMQSKLAVNFEQRKYEYIEICCPCNPTDSLFNLNPSYDSAFVPDSAPVLERMSTDSLSSSYNNLMAPIGDICCPCPSMSEYFLKAGGDGLSIISMKEWKANVGLESKETSFKLEGKDMGTFQLFSLKDVKDGNYTMTITGTFTKAPIKIEISMKGGTLKYTL